MFTAINTIRPAWLVKGISREGLFRWTAVPRTDAEVSLIADMINRTRQSLGPLCLRLFVAASQSASGVLSHHEIASLINEFPLDPSADKRLCTLSACLASEAYRRLLYQAETPAIYVNKRRVIFSPAVPSSATVLGMMT